MKKHLLTLGMIPIVALTLAGCSGAGTRPGPTGGTPAATTTAFDWSVAFARCMRDAGIDYPDPAADGTDAPFQGRDTDGTFEESAATCKSTLTEKLGERPLTDAKKKLYDEWNGKNEKLADCLGKAGYKAEADDEGGFSTDEDIPEQVMATCGGDDYQGVGGAK